jgi:CheY-like chemotaxis protein
MNDATILVVDDSATKRYLLVSWLTRPASRWWRRRAAARRWRS